MCFLELKKPLFYQNRSLKSDIYNASDYYSFGSPMNSRTYTAPRSADRYRYGFNGKENDVEAVSTGEGTQDYGYRIYNPALGRFLSVDPLTSSYPSWSPYPFAMNRPIDGVDLDGCEWKSEHSWGDVITEQSHVDKLTK